MLNPLFILNNRYTLMSNLNKIDPQIFKFNLSNLTRTFLLESQAISNKINILILDAAIAHILSTKRFDKSLFPIKFVVIYSL